MAITNGGQVAKKVAPWDVEGKGSVGPALKFLWAVPGEHPRGSFLIISVFVGEAGQESQLPEQSQ